MVAHEAADNVADMMAYEVADKAVSLKRLRHSCALI